MSIFPILTLLLVKGDGIVDGKRASNILDILIIPGGSLIESQSITPQLKKDTLEIVANDKFIRCLVLFCFYCLAENIKL